MRRLYPQIIENENLRIRVNLPKVKEMLFEGEFKYYDEEY
jgi:hypothetical protein